MGVDADDGDGDELKRQKRKDGAGEELVGACCWRAWLSGPPPIRLRDGFQTSCSAAAAARNDACSLLLHLRPNRHTFILRRMRILFRDRHGYFVLLRFCVFAAISSCAALGIGASRKLCRSESPL